MTLFIIIATLLTLVVLWALCHPLLNGKSQVELVQRNEQNIHFAKQRLQELETQKLEKSISEHDYSELKTEIELSLANDLHTSETNKKNTSGNKGLIISLCTILPIAAIALYLITGTPEGLKKPEQADKLTQQDVELMILQIEQRLQKTPDDAKGWQILANVSMSLGHFDKAITANKNLLRLEGDTAARHVAIADAMSFSNKGNISPQAIEHIQKALALEVMNPQALWIDGLSKMQNGQMDEARATWNKLLPLLQDSPKQHQELAEIIQQSYGEQELQKASTGLMTVNVSLDPSIAHLVKLTDTVFVIAKAQQGPPAPLAVKRLTVKDLPATVSLSDSDAMVPQLAISKFKNIKITARIAKSGNPIAKKGDIQSNQSATSNDSKELIELIISDVLN